MIATKQRPKGTFSRQIRTRKRGLYRAPPSDTPVFDKATGIVRSWEALATGPEWPALVYRGKVDERALLDGIPDIELQEIGVVHAHNGAAPLNQLIHSENLCALKTLSRDRRVAGKVRLIYIDPPFATNQDFRVGSGGRTATISKSNGDSHAYSDRLIGAEFLEYLRQRLILLRDLLAADGSIYVHLDDTMGHYLKVLMDEVFGARHFRSSITRIKCNPKNFERRAYGNVKDCIFFYSKSSSYVWNDPREGMSGEEILRLFPRIDERGRRYTSTPLHAPGETKDGPTGRSWKGLMPPSGRHWRYGPRVLDELDRKGLIEWSNTGNPRKIIFADDALARGKRVQDVWNFKDSPYPSYPTEKNIALLERIILASSNPKDIVLDCFAGSGTTLVAAKRCGRRWIGIDESSEAIRMARLRLTGEGEMFKVLQSKSLPS